MDPQQNILILITGALNLGLLALLIWGLHLRATRRARRLEMLHEERMLAMEKGIPLAEMPQMEESLRAWPDRVASSDPRWTLMVGVISVFLGAGIMATVLTIKSNDARQFWPLGLLPMFWGFGFLLLYGLLRHGRK